MRFEGQRTLKPTTYHPERFKKKEKLLIEIIVDMGNCYMKLYFISSIGALKLSKKGSLIFTDFKSGMVYNEDSKNVDINIYDAYTVETLRIDYDGIDNRYHAIEKCLIYANGQVLPVVKHHRKIRYPNPMGYEYSTILKKEG